MPFDHKVLGPAEGLRLQSGPGRDLVFKVTGEDTGGAFDYFVVEVAPNVDGLYFASETFRSRGVGVDRAARAGLTVVEDYLGRRLDGGFGWRY